VKTGSAAQGERLKIRRQNRFSDPRAKEVSSLPISETVPAVGSRGGGSEPFCWGKGRLFSIRSLLARTKFRRRQSKEVPFRTVARRYRSRVRRRIATAVPTWEGVRGDVSRRTLSPRVSRSTCGEGEGQKGTIKKKKKKKEQRHAYRSVKLIRSDSDVRRKIVGLRQSPTRNSFVRAHSIPRKKENTVKPGEHESIRILSSFR